MRRHSSEPNVPGAPRARKDPIRSRDAALAVIDLARAAPPRQEIIAFLLDEADRGMGIIIDVTDVRSPRDALLVAELLGETGADDETKPWPASSMIIASVRVTEPADEDLLADIDLWQQLSDLADDHGITLREWFVITPSEVFCPRDLLGEPDRWPRWSG